MDWHETAATANEEDPDSQESEHMPGSAPEQDHEEEGGPEEDKVQRGNEEGEGGGLHMKRLSSLLVILSI